MDNAWRLLLFAIFFRATLSVFAPAIASGQFLAIIYAAYLLRRTYQRLLGKRVLRKDTDGARHEGDDITVAI